MAASALTQFLPVAPVASVAKRAEPVETVGLTDDGARPHDLPALAPRVARGTHVIQPAKGRRQSSVWGKARWRAASRVPSMSKTTQSFPVRSTRPPGLLLVRVVREWATLEIIKKERAQGFDRRLCQRR